MSRRLDQDWTPDEDDLLGGSIIDVMTVPTIKYGDVDLAVIRERNTDIKWGVWHTPKMLKTLFERQRPAPGSLIAIQYNGKRGSAKGRQYKHFSMRVERSLEDDGTTWIEAFRAALDQQSDEEATDE